MKKYLWLALLLAPLLSTCGKPGPTFFPFTCDMGNTTVHFSIRDNLSKYEVIAENPGLGITDVIYRGHEEFVVDFLNTNLPFICTVLGGQVIEEEGQDLHDL